MICKHCGHEMEDGKFCNNCGAPLEPVVDEPTIPVDATRPQLEVGNDPELATETGERETNNVKTDAQDGKQEKKPDFSDQLADAFTNFGHFFMTLVKEPSKASKANHHDISSAIITIIAFALFVSMSVFLPHAFIARTNWFIPAPSLFYEFIVPIVLIVVMLLGFISLTFAATKIAKNDYSYQDVFGKYGAYLLPYGLTYVAGIVLSLAHIPVIASVLIVISILGPIFVIPACILFGKEATGFDRIYTLLSLYFVELLFIILIANSLFGRVLEGLFRNLF